METKRLIQFKCIVDSGSLVKASQILAISSGGLSKSIKALEDELGFNLFFRRGRELQLTELGRNFYDRLPYALQAIKQLTSVAPASSDSFEKRIRFVSFEVFTTYFLSSFISKYLMNDEVEIRERTPGEMEDLIASGASDIGITYEPIPKKGLEFLKITQLQMALYGGKKYTHENVSFDDLPFAIPVNPLEGAPSGNRGLDGWPEHLFPRAVKYRVDMMETALQLTLKEKAVCFVPEFIGRYVNESSASQQKLYKLMYPKGFKTIKRNVYLVLRKNEEESALVKKLSKELRLICRSN